MPEPFDIQRLDLEPDSEVLKLLSQFEDCQTLKFRDGEYLIRERDAGQETYLVLKGGLVVEQESPCCTSGENRPTQLATLLCSLETPAIVGEMAYLGSQSRSASVKSSGASFTLQLSPHHIDAIIESYPELTRIICRQFSVRLRESNRVIADLQARFQMHPESQMLGAQEILFQIGDTADTLLQIVTGQVRLSNAKGDQVISAEDLPKGFLGFEDVLRERPRSMTATTESPCFVVKIPEKDLPAFIRHHPDLVLSVLRKM